MAQLQPALQSGQFTWRRARNLFHTTSILTWVVVLLSGCMAELQTGRMPASAPSAPRPSATVAALPTTISGQLPSAPGSMAPDPATAAPAVPSAATLPTVSLSPTPTAAPVATPLPPLALPTATLLTDEERWRAQQQDRVVFDGLVRYSTSGSELWWFDPVNQQHVILGRLTGEFVAQAQFVTRGQGVQALELPYQINTSYGLTALSPALLERIAAAGYGSDWIETYIFLSPDVTPL